MKTYTCAVWICIGLLLQGFVVEGRKRSDPENAEPEGEGEGQEEYEEDEEAILSLVDLGTPVKRGAFPNVGVILFDGLQICGCTLIDKSHVLTAASCLTFLKASDIPRLSVYINTVKLKSYNPGAVITKVTSYKLHELYNKVKSQGNDIAVISLDSNIVSLDPLNLPVDDRSNDFEGTNATMLRWVPKNEGVLGQKILSGTSVTILTNADCSDRYNYTIPSTSLCAFTGAGNNVTCKDDSNGGPLIVAGRQVGIMSYGKGCMDSFYPGVYTRVTSYIDWIQAAVASL